LVSRSIKTRLLEGDSASSHLYLAAAGAGHSGLYVCSAGGKAKATLALHILNGECEETNRIISTLGNGRKWQGAAAILAL